MSLVIARVSAAIIHIITVDYLNGITICPVDLLFVLSAVLTLTTVGTGGTFFQKKDHLDSTTEKQCCQDYLVLAGFDALHMLPSKDY